MNKLKIMVTRAATCVDRFENTLGAGGGAVVFTLSLDCFGQLCNHSLRLFGDGRPLHEDTQQCARRL